MNIILNDISYTLAQTENTANHVVYDVYKGVILIGKISRVGIEIHYTARDTEGNIKGSAATLRDTLESMVLHMYYHSSYTGDRYIETLGAWIEGERVKVEYERNGIVKHAERVVRYSGEAGDLYITLDNKKYFYCEFE